MEDLRQALVVVVPCARLLDRLRMRLYARVSGRKEGEGQLCRNRNGADFRVVRPRGRFWNFPHPFCGSLATDRFPGVDLLSNPTLSQKTSRVARDSQVS